MNHAGLQTSVVSLRSELPYQLLVVRELLPSLHDHVQSVKVDDCSSLSFSHTLVVFVQHFMQVALLAQDLHLMVVYFEHFLLQIERVHSRESFFEYVEAEGSSGDPCCLLLEPVLF